MHRSSSNHLLNDAPEACNVADPGPRAPPESVPEEAGPGNGFAYSRPGKGTLLRRLPGYSHCHGAYNYIKKLLHDLALITRQTGSLDPEAQTMRSTPTFAAGTGGRACAGCLPTQFWSLTRPLRSSCAFD